MKLNTIRENEYDDLEDADQFGNQFPDPDDLDEVHKAALRDGRIISAEKIGPSWVDDRSYPLCQCSHCGQR